ncbi:hypothetical protein JCM14635_39020 [Megalodesulfovibrio paquesii]
MPSTQLPVPALYTDPEYKRYVDNIDKIHAVHYKSGSLTGMIEARVKSRMQRLSQEMVPPFLDLGCGTGTGFSRIGDDADIIGVDNNIELLRKCKQLHPQATLICCDCRKAPLADNVIGSMFSIDTLEHVFHLEVFVESMARMLNDDGRLIVVIPTEGGLAWSLGRALLTSRRNSKLLQVNYNKVIKIDHCNTAWAIDNALNKYFHVLEMVQYPFGMGSVHVNAAFMYKLAKRKPATGELLE